MSNTIPDRDPDITLYDKVTTTTYNLYLTHCDGEIIEFLYSYPSINSPNHIKTSKVIVRTNTIEFIHGTRSHKLNISDSHYAVALWLGAIVPFKKKLEKDIETALLE